MLLCKLNLLSTVWALREGSIVVRMFKGIIQAKNIDNIIIIIIILAVTQQVVQNAGENNYQANCTLPQFSPTPVGTLEDHSYDNGTLLAYMLIQAHLVEIK